MAVGSENSRPLGLNNKLGFVLELRLRLGLGLVLSMVLFKSICIFILNIFENCASQVA